MPPASNLIYLDYAAETPLRAEVQALMLELFDTPLGNPSSTHGPGQKARKLIDEARAQVAAAIGAASPDEIIFTSGGTEANNLALRGICPYQRSTLVTSAIEHSSVSHCAQMLSGFGTNTITLPVDNYGQVKLAEHQGFWNPAQTLLSIGLVNNETGSIANLEQIAAHKGRALLHCDAVQALGKVAIDMQQLEIDLLALSAHKIYGPGGVGALYCRQGVVLSPLFYGGKQEQSRRAGSEPTIAIAAFGLACQLITKDTAQLATHHQELQLALLAQLKRCGVRANMTGSTSPAIISLRLPQKASPVLEKLQTHGIACSLGSACNAGTSRPSSTLLALGLSPEQASCTLRISLGKSTLLADISTFCEVLAGILGPQSQ